MPAIPIYKASPINATKASGISPQTAQSDETEPCTVPSQTANSTSAYPAAQPGSRPYMPAPTGVPQPSANLGPTPTQALRDTNPPGPQPGAVPVPPTRTIPPPPKAGETLRNDQPQITTAPMPHQMAYTPLGAPELGAQRSSTTTTTIPIPSSMAHPLGGRSAGDELSHPPGYHQNVHASDFSSAQGAAHGAAIANGSRNMPFQPSGSENDEGVWGTAKKWAVAAGEGLAAAENEVWRRINKE